MLDTKIYYKNLALNKTFSEAELLALLTALDTAVMGLANLADCQAATLESLPKSAPKSQRKRHVLICEAAARYLNSDRSHFSTNTRPELARERCLKAISDSAA